MQHPLVSTMITFVLLVSFLLAGLGLRSCEKPPTAPDDPIQYESTHEATDEDTTAPTEPERIQYSNDLPRTGGARLW